MWRWKKSNLLEISSSTWSFLFSSLALVCALLTVKYRRKQRNPLLPNISIKYVAYQMCLNVFHIWPSQDAHPTSVYSSGELKQYREPSLRQNSSYQPSPLYLTRINHFLPLIGHILISIFTPSISSEAAVQACNPPHPFLNWCVRDKGQKCQLQTAPSNAIIFGEPETP